MKKRSVISALFALSLAACSAPQSLQPTDSSQTDSSSVSSSADLIVGNPSAAEEVNAVDNTPATTDQNLQATAVAWTGTKFAFNDPKEVEYGAGLTSDSSGNVIVVGSSYGFNGLSDLSPLLHQQNLVITKFNAAGAVTWKRMIGSSVQGVFKTAGFNSQDRPFLPAGVVADPSGNIYVSGTVGGLGVDGTVERLSWLPATGSSRTFLISRTSHRSKKRLREYA